MKNVLVLLLLMLATTKAVACSCAFHDGTLEEAVIESYQNASAVVLATAEHVENLEPFVSDVWSEEKGHHKETYYNKQRTQFVALKSWKGEHGKRFFTEIVIACCMCGYSFEEGENYLLYLHGTDKNGYFSTSSCSRTKKATAKIEMELEILSKIGLIG
ncbi:hypothetical protein K8B83_16320 [Shewanella inventionis]|uniref:hypothetical protein n=1 Tax=Shewanella inventionis TaxID=1738770 RepID=UPI001CBB5873|nr:hypothetical protein [Shewanella inventionis]UAL42406.1 hypothetical protein K8B83_16320 [Shewanella inventionis]